MIRETLSQSPSGLGTLILLIVLILATILAIPLIARSMDNPERAMAIVVTILVLVCECVALGGFFTVEPNQGVVLTLFGNYKGTEKQPGLRWANPFYSKKKVSLRTRNFETAKLKVNDQDGNPIEIGAVVVWQVVDTAEAVFQVDNYENYVHVQSEAALRNLATSYAYDAHVEDQFSLRGNTAEVAAHLKREIEDRLSKAGVHVMEARISHLAYSPEIAQAMLQRQQASAIIAARQKIVEGAVGMVEMALELLSQKGVVHLDAPFKPAC